MQASMDDSQDFSRQVLYQKYKKILLLICVFAMGITLFAGIFISQIDARFSLSVYSSSSQYWWPNAPVMLRVEARTVPLDQPLNLISAKAYWKKPQQNQIYATYPLKDRFGHFFQGQITTPIQAGIWELEIEVLAQRKNSMGVEEKERVSLKTSKIIDLSSSIPPALAWAENTYPSRVKASSGPINIEVLYADQQLSYALNSDILIYAHGEKGPYQGKLSLKESEEGELKLPHEIDIHNGVGILDVKLQRPRAWLSLEIPPLDSLSVVSTADWYLYPSPTELKLKTETQRVDRYGLLRWDIESTKKQEFTIDLWWRGVWCMSISHQLNEFEKIGTISIPNLPVDQDLIWIQASHSKYMPENMRSGRYLLYGQNAEAWLFDALKAQKDWKWTQALNEKTLVQNPNDLRYVTSRLKPPISDPSLLVDSGESTLQLVQGFKEVWQKRIASILMLIWALLSIVLLVWMRYQNKKQQQAWQALGESNQIVMPFSMLWYIPAFIFLSSFFAGLIFLILTIRW